MTSIRKDAVQRMTQTDTLFILTLLLVNSKDSMVLLDDENKTDLDQGHIERR